ncbi:putative protein-serine/threonine kinase [Helianthus annuus]|uniref:Protein kinase domain-containing protein n=1 Tax=Helianthus annuus TaxID=4232 RepID=A0A9K3HUX3_HELAN|nr:putative protein-serine/threonine kinase [Helianthus annuus]
MDPLFPGESGVDQLAEIIKILGTPTREEIKCMIPHYTHFKFPQIKAHPWHKVSNWFINARVRLWKPMVEEMYKEEAGDAETESNSSSEIAPKTTKGDRKTSVDQEDLNQSTAASGFDSKDFC